MSRVTLKTYSLKIDADLAKLRLDSLGIKSIVMATDTIFSGAIGGFQLQVEASQQQRAQGFLETYEKELQSNSNEYDFEGPKEDE
jgi:hypothetical protein